MSLVGKLVDAMSCFLYCVNGTVHRNSRRSWRNSEKVYQRVSTEIETTPKTGFPHTSFCR